MKTLIITTFLIMLLHNYLYGNQEKITISIEKLRVPLLNEYKNFLNQIEIMSDIEDNNIRYYNSSSYEELKNLYQPVKFFDELSENNILDEIPYTKVFFKSEQPIGFRINYIDGYIDALLDHSGKIVKEYNSYTKSKLTHLFHRNNLIYHISCDVVDKQKGCSIHYSFESPNAIHYEAVKAYKEFPNQLLTRGQYQILMKEHLLKEEIKGFFETLLMTEKEYSEGNILYYRDSKYNEKLNRIIFIDEINPKNLNYFIKVFYQNNRVIKAQYFRDEQLLKSIEFTVDEQIKKVIDFKNKNIKEYLYHQNASFINELECQYLKGQCIVQEVSLGSFRK